VTPLTAEKEPPAYTRRPDTASVRTSPQLIVEPNAVDRAPLATESLARPRWVAPLTVRKAPPT
jgi:hypothetical protein